MFSTGDDANPWETVRRLSEGAIIAGAPPALVDGIDFDEGAIAKLRAFTGRRSASRASRTRAEFIRDLCRDAGVDPTKGML